MSSKTPISPSPYGRSVSPINYQTIVGDTTSSTSHSTSGMKNPKSKVSKARPATSSRKRPGSGAPVSARKKLKLGRSAAQELPQKSTVNSTPTIREDSPDIQEYFERENLMSHGAEEDDKAPDSEDDLGFSDFEDMYNNNNMSNLGNSNFEANLKNNNDNSNLEDRASENNLNPGPDPSPGPNPNPTNDEANLKQNYLDSLDYSELKEMCTNPDSRGLYGDEALINATFKAVFNKKALDKLFILDRNRVAREYHPIMDQVIHQKAEEYLNKKTLNVLHALSRASVGEWYHPILQQVIFRKARAMAADLDDDDEA